MTRRPCPLSLVRWLWLATTSLVPLLSSVYCWCSLSLVRSLEVSILGVLWIIHFNDTTVIKVTFSLPYPFLCVPVCCLYRYFICAVYVVYHVPVDTWLNIYLYVVIHVRYASAWITTISTP